VLLLVVGCQKTQTEATTPEPPEEAIAAAEPPADEPTATDAPVVGATEDEPSATGEGTTEAPATPEFPAPEGDACEGIALLLKKNFKKIAGEPDDSSSRNRSTYRLPEFAGPSFVYGKVSYAVRLYQGSDESAALAALTHAQSKVGSCSGWKQKKASRSSLLFAKRRTRGVVAIEHSRTRIAGEEHTVEIVIYPRGKPRS